MKKESKRTVFIDPIVILRDSTTRIRLKAHLDECADMKDKISAMQESLKEALAAISEDMKLQPKVVRELLKMCYNNEFEARKAELDEMSEILRLMTLEENQQQNESDD